MRMLRKEITSKRFLKMQPFVTTANNWFSWKTRRNEKIWCPVLLLFFVEYDCWPNYRESVLLCTRQEPREGICLHLPGRNHQTMDVSRLPGRQRVRKCQYNLLRFFFVPTHSCRDVFDEPVAVKTTSPLYNISKWWYTSKWQ